MKYLVDQKHEHHYVWLKNEMTVRPEPYVKLIPKDIYACVDCGLAMEIYNLDQAIEVNRSE